jgi:hypothetical protein
VEFSGSFKYKTIEIISLLPFLFEFLLFFLPVLFLWLGIPGLRNKRANSNKTDTKKNLQRINKTKSWFFEKISKIDKPLANLTKTRRERTQINKIRDKKMGDHNKHQ